MKVPALETLGEEIAGSHASVRIGVKQSFRLCLRRWQSKSYADGMLMTEMLAENDVNEVLPYASKM